MDDAGDTFTVTGDRTSKKLFDTYKKYQDFCKDNHKGVYENKAVPVIQFLAERYHKFYVEEVDPPKIRAYSIDIEVHLSEDGPSGFPDPKDSAHPIVLITVTDMSTKKVFSFGVKEYQDDTDYNVVYYNCGTEENLLKSFFSWWQKHPPDLVTGWNINADYKINVTGGFDLPYIVNRSRLLFGENTNIYKKLSPLGIVSIFEKEAEENFVVDIAGVSIVDYLALYKWYTSKNLESYTLETVCQHELGRGKVEYENDLRWLYHNDWKKYVEYNIEDTYLINDLEEKLEYIKLAQFVTLLCRCPIKMYSSTTNLIEGLMLTRFRRNNQCAPYFMGGSQASYPAAYVKDPIFGKHNWLFSLDIASSYPFAIVTLNMSPETLYGKILDIEEDKIIQYSKNNNFPEFRIEKNGKVSEVKGKSLETFNNALKKKLLSVAPNGVLFYNKPKGAYALMEKDMYKKRKEVKKQMFSMEREYKETGDKDKKRRAENLNTLQKSLKIVINGAYGVTAVPYSRYFSLWIAEAVTAVGRCSIKSGEKYTNEILNNPNEEIKKLLREL